MCARACFRASPPPSARSPPPAPAGRRPAATRSAAAVNVRTQEAIQVLAVCIVSNSQKTGLSELPRPAATRSAAAVNVRTQEAVEVLAVCIVSNSQKTELSELRGPAATRSALTNRGAHASAPSISNKGFPISRFPIKVFRLGHPGRGPPDRAAGAADRNPNRLACA